MFSNPKHYGHSAKCAHAAHSHPNRIASTAVELPSGRLVGRLVGWLVACVYSLQIGLVFTKFKSTDAPNKSRMLS